MPRPLVATLLGLALALAGGAHAHDHKPKHRGKHHGKHHGKHVRKGGPPPWAPAHGYRRKHADGADLRFDEHLGVWQVLGLPDVFFHDDHFFRRAGERWERCSDWRKRQWRPVDATAVPGGLVKRFAPEAPKRDGRGAKDADERRGRAKQGPS